MDISYKYNVEHNKPNTKEYILRGENTHKKQVISVGRTRVVVTLMGLVPIMTRKVFEGAFWGTGNFLLLEMAIG